MSPIWETEETDVIASPPSPYDWDQDSHPDAGVYIFDNAGNVFCVGPGTGDYPIDNILPIADRGSSAWLARTSTPRSRPMWPSSTGIANVGAPLEMECNGLYNNRDEIVLHADLGDALGIDEVGDVEYVTDAYDPFCVGGITLFDDGTLGHDPVTDDKNFTGHARIEVGGSTRNDTTFCVVDTDAGLAGLRHPGDRRCRQRGDQLVLPGHQGRQRNPDDEPRARLDVLLRRSRDHRAGRRQ